MTTLKDFLDKLLEGKRSQLMPYFPLETQIESVFFKIQDYVIRLTQSYFGTPNGMIQRITLTNIIQDCLKDFHTKDFGIDSYNVDIPKGTRYMKAFVEVWFKNGPEREEFRWGDPGLIKKSFTIDYS